jgi:hypothetical protein
LQWPATCLSSHETFYLSCLLRKLLG